MTVEEVFDCILSYSKKVNTNPERDLSNIYNQEFDGYSVGCVINKIIEKSIYEVYLYVVLGKDKIASSLLQFEVEDVVEANNYFEKLKIVVNEGNLNNILELCKKNSN